MENTIEQEVLRLKIIDMLLKKPKVISIGNFKFTYIADQEHITFRIDDLTSLEITVRTDKPIKCHSNLSDQSSSTESLQS